MSHYHTLSYIIISLNRGDRANSAKQKHNSTDICFLVNMRANVIIVDATHLISRYARDFISFPDRQEDSGIINSGSSLYFVQLCYFARDRVQTDSTVIREYPFIIAFNGLFACRVSSCARVCVWCKTWAFTRLMSLSSAPDSLTHDSLTSPRAQSENLFLPHVSLPSRVIQAYRDLVTLRQDCRVVAAACRSFSRHIYQYLTVTADVNFAIPRNNDRI